MIQWGSIPTYIPQTTLFTMPQVFYASQASIFQYNPFASSASNLSMFTPTPQGISSWSNPFSGMFNFTMPTFNFGNLWNNFTTLTGNLYNSARTTVASAATKISDFASKIVAKAKSYLGYNEKDGSYQKFTNGRHEAWCADFATYVARESGANIPHFSSVSDILNWGRQNNKFSTTAKVGDIVIFKGKDKNGKQVSHTGIISKIENGKIYTIEGNASNKVGERNYSLNDSRITGYVSVT